MVTGSTVGIVGRHREIMRFWQDIWLQDIPFATVYLMLFVLSTHKKEYLLSMGV